MDKFNSLSKESLEDKPDVLADSDLEPDGDISIIFPNGQRKQRPLENESKRKRDNFEGDSDFSEQSGGLGVCSDNGERNDSGGSSSSSSSSSSSGSSNDGSGDEESAPSDRALGNKDHSSDNDQSSDDHNNNDLPNNNQSNVVTQVDAELRLKELSLKTKVDDTIVVAGGHGAFYPDKKDNCPDVGEGASTEELDPLLGDDTFFIQDEDGDTILHQAIICGMNELHIVEIINYFEQWQLNLLNHLIQTALNLAVLMQMEHVVRSLLISKACPHLRDTKGRTPVHIACEQGNTSMLRVLLEHTWSCSDLDERLRVTYPSEYCSMEKGAIFDIPNADGQCCIHTAVVNNDLAMLALLLTHGADVNCPERKSHRTALHLATEMGRTEMVALLVDQEDLRIDQKTLGDETAIAIAYIREKRDIYEILKFKGAKVNIKYFTKFGGATAEVPKRCKTTQKHHQ